MYGWIQVREKNDCAFIGWLLWGWKEKGKKWENKWKKSDRKRKEKNRKALKKKNKK